MNNPVLPHIPRCFDYCVNDINNYVDSGQYNTDLQCYAAYCQILLDKHINDLNICVVFDIDETLISTLSIMRPHNYSWFTDKYEDIFIQSYTDTSLFCLKPIVEFYQYCLSKNIPIYIITSRRKKYLSTTQQVLSNNGIEAYKDLILRENEDDYTIKTYKQAMRKKIQDSGQTILLNISDQTDDLDGYATYQIWLQQPFYDISGVTCECK